MASVGEMITGKRAKQQASLAETAQAEQSARLAAETAKVKKVEEGQKQAANRGGGGLLAFVDDEIRAKLKKGFGG